MKGELKSIECDPACGFMVRSHDEGEVVGIAKRHVKEVHHMNVTNHDLKEKMKSA